MGIAGLWDVLGQGEIHDLEDYAAEHFKRYRRPLRIAVDEACWRFCNLSDSQVQEIRKNEEAANPIEKTIFWRILRFWKLNIQLLFVYDGLRKPGKTRRGGRGGGKVDQERIRLLHRMFDLMEVPYHQAQGESEAECAKLQRLGVVDAVWSDDGDSLMFGCTRLIKRHRVNGKPDLWRIRVYHAAEIKDRLDLDADSFVIFALLSGGDYDEKALRGVGPESAKVVARTRLGLGQSLRNVRDETDLRVWRLSLMETLHSCGKLVEVPPDFPKWKIVKGYRDPAVSPDEQCADLRKLRGGWTQPINHARLRVEMVERHNFWTRDYLHHFGLVYLVRELASTSSPEQREQNATYGVQLKSTRRRKADDNGVAIKPTVKIKFDAHKLLDIDLQSRPPGHSWSKPPKKPEELQGWVDTYDPFAKEEGEILECFLHHGLPEGALYVPSPPKKRKSKAQDDATPPESSTHRAEVSKKHSSASNAEKSSASPHPEASPKKRKRAKNSFSDDTSPPKKKHASRSEPARTPTPPAPAFRRLELPDYHPRSKIVDLCENDGDDGTGSVFGVSSTRTDQTTSCAETAPSSTTSVTTSTGAMSYKPLPKRGRTAHSVISVDTPSHIAYVGRKVTQSSSHGKPEPQASSIAAGKPLPSPQAELAEPHPGEIFTPATLRELRLAKLLKGVGPQSSPISSPSAPASNRFTSREVIDLT